MFWRHTHFDRNRRWPSVGLAGLVVVFTLTSGGALQALDGRQNADARHADSARGEEAVLGTFHLKARARQAPQRQGRTDPFDASPPEFKSNSTADFVHLFADARAAQDAGDSEEAQRLFERVIAIRPNSELADEARKHLSELYRVPRNQTGNGVPRRRPAHKAPHGRNARAPLDPSRGVYGPIRPSRDKLGNSEVRRRAEIKQRSRRLVMLERQFIADVGDRIFFAAGSDQLGARARAVLAAQADWLNAHPDIFVTIEGHADDGAGAVRQDHYNLSLVRAEAVRQRLIAEGVREARMASNGRGRTDPVAACTSARCAAQNRRVVTVISAGPIPAVGESDRPYGTAETGTVTGR